MFENVDGRTDDGRTDGRTTDAGVTGILIAHLGAFGSGELKRCLFLRDLLLEQILSFKSSPLWLGNPDCHILGFHLNMYSKTCLKRPLKKGQNKDLNNTW